MGDEETMDMLKEGRLYIGSSDGFMSLPIFGSADVAKLEESPISIKPLTAEEERKHCLYHTPKGFTMTGTGTVMMNDEAMSRITRQLLEADCVVNIEPSDRRLPRKMKKAMRNGWLYRRDTKWKRKAALWQERNNIKLLGRITKAEDGNFTFTGTKV